MILIALAALTLALALGNVFFWPRIRKSAAQPSSISILIPARNEENNIEACLQAALQGGERVREVLVYDDHSSDRTSERVLQVAGTDNRIRRLAPEPLPPGWCGKNFACSVLAREANSDWLLFLDADARLAPQGADRIADDARIRNLTLLSCWPGLDLYGFSEKALMPMPNVVVFTVFPAVLSLIRNEPSLGIAHGACLLFEKSTYTRLGGHESVKGELFEDTRLAQFWRSSGERALCLDGQDVVRVRMYSSFREIWWGFQKNFYPAFRTEAGFWLFLAFHFTVFLLPFLLGNWTAATLIVLARFSLVWRFRHPWWSPVLHPLSEAILLALGISSWWRCRFGQGVTWKGRIYRDPTRAHHRV